MFDAALQRIRRSRQPPPNFRGQVGGLWEEMGQRQFDFMVEQGLKPESRLLDVGCGSLRGGVHFVRYLDDGHYHGLDLDQALLDAGRRELATAGYADRKVALLADDAFRFGRFEQTFDYAIAQSVFSHLPFNVIMRCLAEIEKVMSDGGRFYATFFRNHGARLNLEPYQETPRIATFPDADPFYYDPDVFRWAVEGSSLECEVIGDWDHPRKQQMLVFRKV